MERLARVSSVGIHMLTVFAEDGEMIAFKYDNGGHGWAPRKSFVSEAEALNIIKEREDMKRKMMVDSNLRCRMSIAKEITRVQRELDRLNEQYAYYMKQGDELYEHGGV